MIKALLYFLIPFIIFSCQNSKQFNGNHTSSIKHKEVKRKSNFNLKQSQAIIEDNRRSAKKDKRLAEAVRKDTIKRINRITRTASN